MEHPYKIELRPQYFFQEKNRAAAEYVAAR